MERGETVLGGNSRQAGKDMTATEVFAGSDGAELRANSLLGMLYINTLRLFSGYSIVEIGRWFWSAPSQIGQSSGSLTSGCNLKWPRAPGLPAPVLQQLVGQNCVFYRCIRSARPRRDRSVVG